MRISDWSSDVCSSDLLSSRRAQPNSMATPNNPTITKEITSFTRVPNSRPCQVPIPTWVARSTPVPEASSPASAPDTEERRVGTECSVRTDPGGRRHSRKNSTDKSHDETLDVKE